MKLFLDIVAFTLVAVSILAVTAFFVWATKGLILVAIALACALAWAMMRIEDRNRP